MPQKSRLRGGQIKLPNFCKNSHFEAFTKLFCFGFLRFQIGPLKFSQQRKSGKDACRQLGLQDRMNAGTDVVQERMYAKIFAKFAFTSSHRLRGHISASY